MQIQSAQFVKSSPSVQDLPEGGWPELAFIGRSNVGKSSLLNYLAAHKNLAKTSTTPGRTKLINHFLINESLYFVDLPGYGFAKSSKTDRIKWGQTTEEYLLTRPGLKCLFVLLDINVPPQPTDLEFLSWLKLHRIPLAVVLTKTDKLNQSKRHHQRKAYDLELSQVLEPGDEIFETSIVKKTGRQELLQFIEGLVKLP